MELFPQNFLPNVLIDIVCSYTFPAKDCFYDPFAEDYIEYKPLSSNVLNLAAMNWDIALYPKESVMPQKFRVYPNYLYIVNTKNKTYRIDLKPTCLSNRYAINYFKELQKERFLGDHMKSIIIEEVKRRLDKIKIDAKHLNPIVRNQFYYMM